MTDLSRLSDSDLRLLASGNVRMMSADGLRALAGQELPQAPKPKSDTGIIGNALMGALKGATDIGATILSPIDATGITGMSSDQRRAALAQFFKDNARPDSIPFKAGELGADIAGTAGVGGVLGKSAMAIGRYSPALAGAAPKVAAALESGGFRLGSPAASTIFGKVADASLRAGAGAANGVVTAGMINPNEAGAGAVIGGAMPGAARIAGMAGNAISSGMNSAATSLMQSALKPTIKQLKSGDAAVAVRTMLDNGINANGAGVEKLRGMIGDVNDEIANRIAASDATVDKQKVLSALTDVRNKFSNQVSPTSDLSAIDSVSDDFVNHPGLPGDSIPVQDAQAVKQGTYRILAKKYGQLGSAETEAQKAVARGLKDQIAEAVPEVGPLNAKESELITTLGVAERRALMELNKNPMGLAALAHNPASWTMFMADKSALFKSLAARMANSTSQTLSSQSGLLGNAAANPLIRSGLLSIETNP